MFVVVNDKKSFGKYQVGTIFSVFIPIGTVGCIAKSSARPERSNPADFEKEWSLLDSLPSSIGGKKRERYRYSSRLLCSNF